MAFERPQIRGFGRIARVVARLHDGIETWLEDQREQVALWVPVALGIGIGAWFGLPARTDWIAFCVIALAVACIGAAMPEGGRLRRMLVAGGILACVGCLLVWGKALVIGEPPLGRSVFTQVDGEVLSVDAIPARGITRLLVRPNERADLPGKIRVNVADDDMPGGIGRGAIVRFRTRLMPPTPQSIPGGFDFARRAYFQGIGATGKALKPIAVLRPASEAATWRARLALHIRGQLDGSAGGIAVALATGDQGAIAEPDAEAMRRSGLAHLLSISGLHVTALIGAVMILLLRVLALSQRAALNLPLMLIAAGGGAMAGIGYTLFTGAEVPTVRSCIAALLVLGGLALGRDSITLRLVATGAIIVMLVWPEALIGPSFQMSFAAIIAIVALSETRAFARFAMVRDEPRWRRWTRAIAVMVLTGLAVEAALMPIALFHFHKGGMLGAFANLIAIPLTTFVVMPLEALALLADIAGAGAPFWWLAGRALEFLLAIAHGVAASPAAVLLAPAFPSWIFGTIVLGGLWCLLWRGRGRWAGAVPVLVGVIAIIGTNAADVLVTGDGRHAALRTDAGRVALLRPRAGDYVRDMFAEGLGHEGDLAAIGNLPEARCSPDLCMTVLQKGDRRWSILMTRTAALIERSAFVRDCARSDIVISDRRLPYWCRPRWLRIDKALLTRTGGMAIDLDRAVVRHVRDPGDAHPWIPNTALSRRPIGRAGPQP